MTAIAVTIAGSDSSGGAGIQADLKTFSALGVYGASVICALTAQNTRGVTGVFDVPADFVTAQIDAVFSDLSVDAVKIGMLSRSEVIRAVRDGLDRWRIAQVVLDPVMVATSGDLLLVPEAVATIREVLLPRATLITPNLHEAARLTGRAVAEDRGEMLAQAEALIRLGAQAALLKGGHGSGNEACDVLLEAGGSPVWLSAPRYPTENTHGTGCTLSSAIAAGLAGGAALVPAVRAAKAYLTAAIRGADRLKIGHGHGPVDHFHALWPSHGHEGTVERAE
jgi:hydroxymethylpyrimidine/phosphomethylpyrimidine kinase